MVDSLFPCSPRHHPLPSLTTSCEDKRWLMMIADSIVIVVIKSVFTVFTRFVVPIHIIPYRCVAL